MQDIVFLHGSHNPRCIATVDKTFTYHTLQFMVRGGIELYVDGRRYEMSGAWMWSCNPGPWVQFHEWPRNRPWDHRYIAFTGPGVSDWIAHGMLPPDPEPVSAEDLPELVQLFDRLLVKTREVGKWNRLAAINLLEQILLRRAAVRQAPGPENPEWLTDALNLLSTQHGHVDYAELAETYGMSLTTFRRRFRQITGSAVHEYAIRSRVAEARRMLGETDLSIKKIASMLGYRDVFYFGRDFKRQVGVAPGMYRKSVQR